MCPVDNSGQYGNAYWHSVAWSSTPVIASGCAPEYVIQGSLPTRQCTYVSGTIGTWSTSVTGACLCPANRNGANCLQCASGYFGSNCTSCSLCQSGATCTSGVSGGCVCSVNWSGTYCDQCSSGHFGPNCTSCLVCQNGATCTSGLSGGCHCPASSNELFGPTCETCPCPPDQMCSSGPTGTGQCSSVDQIALTAFYNELTVKPKWTTTFSLCGQPGVTCNNAHVVQLSLADMNLTGSIATELGQLSQLTFLYVTNSSLPLASPIPFFLLIFSLFSPLFTISLSVGLGSSNQ